MIATLALTKARTKSGKQLHRIKKVGELLRKQLEGRASLQINSNCLSSFLDKHIEIRRRCPDSGQLKSPISLQNRLQQKSIALLSGSSVKGHFSECLVEFTLVGQ